MVTFKYLQGILLTMYKRGQMTVFFIVGILILGTATLVFFLSDFTSSEPQDLLGDSIQNYVQSCVESTAEEGLDYISLHGGYYSLPQLSYDDLPYYYYGGKQNVISKGELETQLGMYMDNELRFCLQNFLLFRNQGYTFDTGDVKTNVAVKKEAVVFDVVFPLTVKRDALARSFDVFTAVRSHNVGKVHEGVTSFVNQEEESALCISCLHDIANEMDVRVEMIPIDNDIIFDVYGEDITYSFANQYNWGIE
jgi:hypothetical protein